MEGIYKHYIIDMSCNNNFVQVPTVQGDGNNVRGFEVELISNNVQYVVNPEDTIVTIAGTKPDTKQVFNECQVTEEGYILVDITSQMSAVAGRGDYSIVLMDKNTNSQLKSFPFYILTTASSFSASEIISSDEFQVLTKGVVNINIAQNKVNKAISDMELVKEAVLETEATFTENENQRITNEETRIANETLRISNEEKRELQEQNRETKFTNALTKVEDGITKSEEATERANTISEDLETKLANGYFKGDKGDKGEDGKDGVVTTVEMNQLAFNIIDGNLILTYEEGNTDYSKFSINENGDLLYTIE